MGDFITELAVSLDESEGAQLRSKNFIQLPGNLNEGAGGNAIFLWYKKENVRPITRIQFSFTDYMMKGLEAAGCLKIEKDLNAGTNKPSIYLWYYHGTTKYDVPIQDLHISTDPSDSAQKVSQNWQMIPCNLNKFTDGKDVFLCVKRIQDVFVCDVLVSISWKDNVALLKDGYIRMDQNTNEFGDGHLAFIWYRQSKVKGEAVTDVKLSSSDEEYKTFLDNGYNLINKYLTKGQGNPVFLWYLKTGSNSITEMTSITDSAKPSFKRIGAEVLDVNLDGAWGKVPGLYLTFKH